MKAPALLAAGQACKPGRAPATRGVDQTQAREGERGNEQMRAPDAAQNEEEGEEKGRSDGRQERRGHCAGAQAHGDPPDGSP